MNKKFIIFAALFFSLSSLGDGTAADYCVTLKNTPQTAANYSDLLWSCILSNYNTDNNRIEFQKMDAEYNAMISNINNIPNPIDVVAEKSLNDQSGSDDAVKTHANEGIQKNIAKVIFKLATEEYFPKAPIPNPMFNNSNPFLGNAKRCPLATLSFTPDAGVIPCSDKLKFENSGECKVFEMRTGFAKGGVESVVAGALQASLAKALKENINVFATKITLNTNSNTCLKNNGEVVKKYLKNLAAFKFLRSKISSKTENSELTKKCSQNGADLAKADCESSTYLKMAYNSLVATYSNLAICHLKQNAVAHFNTFIKSIYSVNESDSDWKFLKKNEIKAVINDATTNSCFTKPEAQKKTCIYEKYINWAYAQLKSAFEEQFPDFGGC